MRLAKTDAAKAGDSFVSDEDEVGSERVENSEWLVAYNR